MSALIDAQQLLLAAIDARLEAEKTVRDTYEAWRNAERKLSEAQQLENKRRYELALALALARAQEEMPS